MPDKVQARLSKFEAETRPLIARYQSRGIVVAVDGVGEPDEVYARILAVL
jgi:adenylate kinase